MTTAEMLRSYIQAGFGCDLKVNADLEQAACEIERLETENRKLREAVALMRCRAQNLSFACARALAAYGPIDDPKEF